ncbi:MAG: cysteine desulfurase family protein, partial [Patescibacteria group bacterium]
LETARDLEKDGVEVVYLPVSREGFVDLKKLKDALNERTVLVSIMYANNEIGTIQPITEIAGIMRNFRNSKQIQNSKSNPLNPSGYSLYPIFHTDAVQAFQFLGCNVDTLGVDLMTLSAHKIYGPKGIGALYVRGFSQEGIGSGAKNSLHPSGYWLYPMVTGGGQEFGLRSGTENVPLIVGFAKAAELAVAVRAKEKEKVGDLRSYFWGKLRAIAPDAERNGGEPALPHIVNVYFPHYSAEEMLMKLDLGGLAVSAGSACTARATAPSHVIRALGYGEERAKRSIRFSFGRPTRKGDIDKALAVIKNILVKQKS